jgi:hypothetical protein
MLHGICNPDVFENDRCHLCLIDESEHEHPSVSVGVLYCTRYSPRNSRIGRRLPSWRSTQKHLSFEELVCSIQFHSKSAYCLFQNNIKELAYHDHVQESPAVQAPAGRILRCRRDWVVRCSVSKRSWDTPAVL